MAIQTGVDILTKAVDLTAQGVQSAIGRLRLLGREAKEANKAGGELGAAFTAFKGGAAVAGITLVADQLARAAEGAVELRDSMHGLDRPMLDTTRSALELVPVFGSIVAAGGRITDSIIELFTGSEQASRQAMALARAYQQVNEMIAESAAEATRLWELGDRRRIGLEDEVRLLETILANGLDQEEATRAAIGQETAKKEILLRQGAELRKFEEERLELLRKIQEAAAGTLEDELEFMRQSEKLREDMQRQNEREIELLERRQQLERQLDAEKAQREAKRIADEQKRDADRDAERQAQEADRERDRLQDEQQRRDEAVRQSEDRLVEFRDDRGSTGRAEAFLARRGAQGEARTELQRKANGLLQTMTEYLKKIAEDPTEVIG